MFACNAEAVEPDLMTVAKGLTAGYAPMGAVLMSDAIYNAVADGVAPNVPVGHGHTYSAHPVSAAIGLEVIRLYEEGGILANGIAVTPHFEQGLRSMLSHPLVGDARNRGLLGALELVADKESKRGFDPALRMSERIAHAAYRNGLIFRAFYRDETGESQTYYSVGGGFIHLVGDDIPRHIHQGWIVKLQFLEQLLVVVRRRA